MNSISGLLGRTSICAVAVGAMFAFGADSAEAATISFTGGTGFDAGTVLNDGDGRVAQNNSSDGTSNIDFIWRNTPSSPDPYTAPAPYLAYAEFTSDASFRLTFANYSPTNDYLGTDNERSGFQIYSGSFGGTLTPLLPLTPITADACGSDVNAAFGSTDCVLVTGNGNDGTTFVVPPITYDIKGGAGTYVLMFSEGNEPNNGTAEFIISAVPLPAGGLLLLTALGGLAAARRKRKAA